MNLEGFQPNMEWVEATLIAGEVSKKVTIQIGNVQPGGSGKFSHAPVSPSPKKPRILAQLSEPVEETKPHENDAKLVLPDGRVFKGRVSEGGRTFIGKQR